MLSFNFALEGPSIPSVAEDREYQSHFSMKRIPKKNIANNAPSNFIFNETFFFLMRFFDYAFEGPSIALDDDDDDDDDYKSHFEKPYQKKYTTSSGRGQSSKRRGTTRGRK
jgi:hypothetical protein